MNEVTYMEVHTLYFSQIQHPQSHSLSQMGWRRQDTAFVRIVEENVRKGKSIRRPDLQAPCKMAYHRYHVAQHNSDILVQ